MKKLEIRRIVKMEEIFEVSFADNNEEEEEGEGNQEKHGNGNKYFDVRNYLDLRFLLSIFASNNLTCGHKVL